MHGLNPVIIIKLSRLLTYRFPHYAIVAMLRSCALNNIFYAKYKYNWLFVHTQVQITTYCYLILVQISTFLMENVQFMIFKSAGTGCNRCKCTLCLFVKGAKYLFMFTQGCKIPFVLSLMCFKIICLKNFRLRRATSSRLRT